MLAGWLSESELWLWAFLTIELFGLLLVPAVLLSHREPPAAIAWILALVFLPGVGSMLFLLHGRDRMRWPARRKRAADAVVSTRLQAARGRALAHSEDQLAGMDPEDKPIFQVCRALGATELSAGNRVAMFADGRLAWDAVQKAIESATSSVFAEYYLIQDDQTGARFREHLVRAAERGVEVRLLVDAYGCFWLPSAWFRPLKRAQVKVAQFLPLRLALRLPMNLRTHRKILVVDGKTAFAGGLNIGNEYVADSPKEPMWRDTLLRIQGPAVASLTTVFLQDWYFMSGASEVSPSFFPEAPRDGSAVVAVVPSGPDNAAEAVHRVFFAAIVGARRRIWITTPYFVPDRSLLVALETAAKRGVDVQMILPFRSNHRVTHKAGRSFYAELLDYGISLFEFEPSMIHCKTMLVDDHLGLVGSANMDTRSFRLNFEVHTLVHDLSLAKELALAFEKDRAVARRIDAAEWRARPWPSRVAEGSARLISPIL